MGEGRREKRERQQRDYESRFMILEIDELNAAGI
jgi:hypothetical protein